MIFSKLKAFLKRDLLIVSSYRFELFMQLVLVSIIAFSSLYYFFLMNALSGNGFLEMILGIILIDFMFACMGVFSLKVREAQQLGNFEILFLSKTSFIFILFASLLSTLMKCFFRMIFYLIIATLFSDIDISISEYFKILALIIFNTLPFIGIGLISASFIVLFKRGNPINFFTALISILLSGIFFSTEQLPKFFQIISDYSPIALTIEVIQVIIESSENSKVSIFDSMILLTIYSLVAIFFGLRFMKYVVKRSKKTGTLNFY